MTIPSTEDTVRRVRGEFLEMPGLRLTNAQARRLWGLDDESCRSVLQILIDSGFLQFRSDGTYARLTEGATAVSLRRAKADLHVSGSAVRESLAS